MPTRSIFTGLFAAFAVVLFAAPAAAAPIGTLEVASCAGGGVIVDFNTIDWYNPVGGVGGCIQTGGETSVAYDGGVLGTGVTGVILDLEAGNPFPVQDFMTFTGHPALDFDLVGLGPGVANTVCMGLTLGQSCSVFTGSPFILTLSGVHPITGAPTTTVSLQAFGTVTDLTGSGDWFGGFSTQIAGSTPRDIQIAIENQQQIASTHSGEFEVSSNPIPEPASLLLFGTGLVGTALRARSARRRRES